MRNDFSAGVSPAVFDIRIEVEPCRRDAGAAMIGGRELHWQNQNS